MKYDSLRLENQLCFPLYAASREVIKQYRPVLKSLEAKGFVHRYRSAENERVLMVEITEQGEILKERAVSVPEAVAGCVRLEPEEAAQLYKLLYKVLGNVEYE